MKEILIFHISISITWPNEGFPWRYPYPVYQFRIQLNAFSSEIVFCAHWNLQITWQMTFLISKNYLLLLRCWDIIIMQRNIIQGYIYKDTLCKRQLEILTIFNRGVLSNLTSKKCLIRFLGIFSFYNKSYDYHIKKIKYVLYFYYVLFVFTFSKYVFN